MSKVKFEVPGIHCNVCKDAIKATVGQLRTVNKVDVDLESNTVTVDYEDEDINHISEKIKNAGYDVAGVQQL